MAKLRLLSVFLLTLASIVGNVKCEDENGSSATKENRSYYNMEEKLYLKLMENYVKEIRPVSNTSKTLPLNFALSVIQLEELNENTQSFGLNAWIKMQWQDERLAWDPQEYGGISQIRIPMKYLWNPDIVPFNHHGDIFDGEEQLPIIYSYGTVFWIPKVHLRVKCDLDMYDFPFDRHECKVIFGSWTHHEGELNMTKFSEQDEILEGSFFDEHPTWTISGVGFQRNPKKYPCCKEIYVDFTYNFVIRRRGQFHTNTFVAPSIVMGLLIPFVFFLPAESNEKTIFGLGLLLGNVLMLDQMESFITTAHPIVPKIGLYYLVNIVLLGLSLGVSALVTNVWYRSSNRGNMPGCLRGINGILSKLFCVKREDYLAVSTVDQPSRQMESMNGDSEDPSTFGDDMKRFMHTSAKAVAEAEWRQFAIVLDRLFLVLFIIVCIITTVSLVR